MKKNYQSPKIKVVKTVASCVICASTEGNVKTEELEEETFEW